MIELAVSKKPKPRITICGECGEKRKDCECAKKQEERKETELRELER